MSQHRPLTSAATPRHGTPRAARRLALFLLVFLTLAAGAPFAAAEMVYYTEDFWHEGEPGFDPIFSHEFEWPAGREESTCWYLWPPYEPADTWALALMYGTRDTITFNLAEGERIVYASAGTAPYAFSPAQNGRTPLALCQFLI